MAQNFTVNYDINVLSQDAVTAINSFTQATKKLDQAMRPFRKLNTSISNLQNNLTKLNAKTYTVKLETKKAVNNVDKLISRLRRLKAEAKGAGINLGSINTAGGVAAGGSSNRSTGGKRVTASAGKTSTSSSVISRNMPKNLGYKLLGPTPLDTGGIMAVDMLKGMGIAYGIAGIGSLISNSVKDYTEYNNIMKTAENILGAHDKRADFKERFAAMERQVRNVGVQTKFTAPQVADASKFLAMAGFDVDAINKSIAPIADIALVGDTDLGETADVVTNIMTGYNISPEKVRKAADIMTMTFTKSNTTLMEIAEAYKYSASLLSAGDVPFEEATAAMGILGNAGIKGSQAGTTMRTIMANIVNPTKKQAAAWKRIGVSRTDKNGNMRDVVDIFEDLNKKDLSLSDFYQIFHKTAAQGAVSLANDVEGWNDIIKANFMSEGLAKQLADEKKNTIQGLWAQLTSMFTEDGIEAFDEIQQPIKDFLRNITNWLGTDEAKNFIKSVARDLMDFAKLLIDVTKQIHAFFEAFRKPIKWFIAFQLKMWPILNLVRVIKAMGLGAAGVLKLASSLGVLSSQMRILGNSMTFANMKKMGFAGMLAGMNGGFGLGQLTPVGNGKLYSERFGREITTATAKRYNSIYGGTNNVGLGGFAPFLGSAVGGVSGAAVGNAVGGSTGAIYGGMIGTLLPALGFMVNNPVGWVTTAAVAIAGITAAIYSSVKAWEAATNAANEYRNSIRLVDGVVTGDGLTNTEAYLNLVYNKEMSTNEVIKERIRLRREELGLTDPGSNNNSASFEGNEFKKAYNLWLAKDGFWHPNGAGNEAQAKINAFLGRNAVQVDKNGHRLWDGQRFNGRDGTIGESDYLAAYSALFMEGANGDAARKAKDSYQNQLSAILRNPRSTFADIQELQKDFENRFIPKNYNKNTLPKNFQYKLKDLYDPEKGFLISNEQLVGSYPYQTGLYTVLNPIYGQQAPVWDAAKKYYEGVNTGKLTEEQVISYISLMDNKMGDWLKEYTSKNINAWLDAIGFDTKTGTFVAKNGLTAENNAKIAAEKMQELVTILLSLGTPAQDAASNLFTLARQLNTIAGGFVWGSDPSNSPFSMTPTNGKQVKVGDVTYQYGSNGMWTPVAGSGFGIMRPVNNATMMGMLGKQKKESQNGTGRNGRRGNGSITPATHNTKGASQADYKQHYNNQTAAPKQVIVKIENLMNVKSIDLSKKDNREVIDNVKQQLTQALVDVVHDFDETWHG